LHWSDNIYVWKAPEGSRYGYIDSKQNTPRFEEVLEDELANLDGNPLANTVQQVYPDNQRAASYVMWKCASLHALS